MARDDDSFERELALALSTTVRESLGGDVTLASVMRATRIAVMHARKLSQYDGATKKRIVIACVRELVEDAPGLGRFDDVLATLCASAIEEVLHAAHDGLVIRDPYDDRCTWPCAWQCMKGTCARALRAD